MNGNQEIFLNEESIWRNITISKDGSKVAAITDDFVNDIFVFDFNLDEGVTFNLFNPTFTQGQSTGDVQYADYMEFDHSGEFLMYDSYNVIDVSFGEQIDYWDISFIQIWDNEVNFWSDGNNIQKLFNTIPENTSIGNPTFAKDAPFIVAFDFIDASGNVTIIAKNIETGAQSDVGIFQSADLTFPNYSIDDSQMIFNAATQNGDPVIGIIGMDASRLNPDGGSPEILINGGRWATWFALGDRELVSQQNINFDFDFLLSPNPSVQNIDINLQLDKSRAINNIEIFDVTGKLVKSISVNENIDRFNKQIDVSSFEKGNYLLTISVEGNHLVKSFVKM